MIPQSERRPEFLRGGAVPFALARCEKFTNVGPVSGYYDEIQQAWQGGKDIAAALTLTLTQTPQGPDQDQD